MKQIDKAALYADETIDYRMPENLRAGEKVSFRFRAGHQDVRHIFMHIRYQEHRGETGGLPEGGDVCLSEQCPELVWERTEHGFDWFMTQYTLEGDSANGLQQRSGLFANEGGTTEGSLSSLKG